MKLIELGLVRPRRSPPRGAMSPREPSGVRMLRASDRGSHRPRALLSGAEKAQGGKRRPDRRRPGSHSRPSPQPPDSTRPRLPAGWAEPKRAWADVGSQQRGWGAGPRLGAPRGTATVQTAKACPPHTPLQGPPRLQPAPRPRARWAGGKGPLGRGFPAPRACGRRAGCAAAHAGGWGAPGGDVTAADAVRRPPPGPSPTPRRTDRCARSPPDVQGPRPARGQPWRGRAGVLS